MSCSTFGSLGFFCYLYVKLPRSTSPHQEAEKEKSEVSDVNGLRLSNLGSSQRNLMYTCT